MIFFFLRKRDFHEWGGQGWGEVRGEGEGEGEDLKLVP